ncbi:MAG: DUF4326 domain-containing protein [Candidatus Baltobacteraceae bacterium]
MGIRIVSVRHEACDAYLGRAMPGKPTEFTRFGNPFKVDHNHSLGATLADYVLWLTENAELIADARAALAQAKRPGCWCAPPGGVDIDGPLICHVQVLMRAVRGDYDAFIAQRARRRRTS